MPGRELEGGEIEAACEDAYAGDEDNDRAYPDGKPVFLLPKVRNVGFHFLVS